MRAVRDGTGDEIGNRKGTGNSRGTGTGSRTGTGIGNVEKAERWTDCYAAVGDAGSGGMNEAEVMDRAGSVRGGEWWGHLR